MSLLHPLGAAAILLAAIPTLARANDHAPALERIRVGGDGTHFVGASSGERIVMWGFNYDHDDAGRLIEDYWVDEWPTVVEDFFEMKDLGANVVRVHLQLAKFMDGPEEPNSGNLDRLRQLVDLAEEVGLYLDLTGLGCYHKQDVPEWYDALGESARWDVQAQFWRAVAGVGKGRAAVFCHDLMNEPLLTGGQGDGWLAGEPLGGKYFVQRITRDLAGRTSEEVAGAWVAHLTSAIREVDDEVLLTVGVIPWAYVFKGAKPLFHGPEAGRPLDFVAVHFYPKRDDVEGALEALRDYEVGKPLVVEEFFPLAAGIEESGAFMDAAAPLVDGWISFYWGQTIEQNEQAGDIKGAIVAAWLKEFRARSPYADPMPPNTP